MAYSPSVQLSGHTANSETIVPINHSNICTRCWIGCNIRQLFRNRTLFYGFFYKRNKLGFPNQHVVFWLTSSTLEPDDKLVSNLVWTLHSKQCEVTLVMWQTSKLLGGNNTHMTYSLIMKHFMVICLGKMCRL